MKEFKLSNTDRVVLIDDDIEAELLRHSNYWYEDNGYACCKSKVFNATIRLHHVVLNKFNGGSSGNLDVDHIDRNPLNNVKSNLRLVTRSQNMVNVPKQKSRSSKYKGVCWDKQYSKWRTIIKFNKKSKFGGLFLNEDDAGKRANELYIEYFGEHALLNIIG